MSKYPDGYNKEKSYKFSNKKKGEYVESFEKERTKDVEGYPFADLSFRGIRKETAEKFNVRMTVSQEDGRTPTAVYFPYYNHKSELVGWKKRDLTKDKHEKGHFTAIGRVGVECKMFGQTYAESIKRKHNTLAIVEGEFDLLAYYQAFVDSMKGTTYAGIEPFVVSVSCGTANAVDSVIHNEQFVKSFSKTVLGFDNDSCTPNERMKGIVKGKEATEAVAAALMSDNLYVAQYPEGMKDPNDMLLAGKETDLQKLFAFCETKFIAEKIVNASSISFEEIVAVREKGAMVNCLPLLMEKINGFRKRELVVLTSASGSGKSTLTSEIAYDLADHGYKMGMIFLEEETKETIQRMIAHRLKINYNKFKFNPLAYASEEQIKEAYDWVCADNRFTFLDHFGSIRVDDLMNKIKTLVYIHKVDYIMFDHLTLACGEGDQSKQTADLDKVMTELAAFVASTDVGVLAISHLNRAAADEIKNISTLDKPKWIRVKKENMRGTSSLEALAWLIIGLDYEILPDRSRGRIQISVLKNRPFGLLGSTDILSMDQTTGRLINAEDWEWTTGGWKSNYISEGDCKPIANSSQAATTQQEDFDEDSPV